MSDKSIFHLKIHRLADNTWQETDDLLAVEEPLEISLQFGPMEKQVQQSIAVTMRTPGMDKLLAAGFLFTEGIIQNYDQVKMIIEEPSGPNTVLVILKEDVQPKLSQAARNFYTTSSCGVCGKASIEAISTVSVFTMEPDTIKIGSDIFFGLQEKLEKVQSVFQSTGGIHAAALFTTDGQLIHFCEDVGRHNALDKLIGKTLTANELPLSQHILLLSGRASFELVQKAVMAGIRVIAAVGAPSSLAVQLAEKHQVSLVGFLRKTRLNVYSGEVRIG